MNGGVPVGFLLLHNKMPEIMTCEGENSGLWVSDSEIPDHLTLLLCDCGNTVVAPRAGGRCKTRPNHLMPARKDRKEQEIAGVPISC